MGDNSRVVWSEGMFLRPQHFQQHDRHIEHWVNGRCGGLRPFDWGFHTLKLDLGQLAIGKLGILACQGLFQDGTPFHLPADDALPLSLELPEGFKNGRVYLSLPLRRAEAAEVDSAARPDALARYRVDEAEVGDRNSAAQGRYPLQIGRLQARLTPDRPDGHACLGVARVREVRADKTVLLDDSFIPPSLACAASASLASYLHELHGLLHSRGDALAGLTVDASRLGASGTGNFVLLQTINRHEPLWAHLAATARLHPEEFYRLGLQLAGELSTFYKPGKRPITFPAYDHDDLQAGFGVLMAELRELLARAIDPNAVRITLIEPRAGLYASKNRAEYIGWLDQAAFILGVKASVASEALRSGFPPQVKIGPGEEIQQLVRLALPGIAISPLPQLPAALPSRPDLCYFGLDKQSEWWKKMSASGGFAIHIGGRFPDLELEFWAVRG